MQHRSLIAAALVLLGCDSDISLDGRPCPCADGWVCCEADNVCIRPGSGPCGPKSVVVEPGSAQLRLGGSQQFVATSSVTWSVDEASGGSIDEHGLYRAPIRPGHYHVRATPPGGASATASVTVGPTELVRALGFPGGMGSANGTGQSARLGRAGSIVGDAQYLYVIDEPALEPRLDPLPGGAPVSDQPADGPSGVRRIARSNAEVSWLVDDMPLRGLTIADSKLYAGARESKSLESAARRIVRIDPNTGAMGGGFGAVGYPLQDGFGSNTSYLGGAEPAGFGNITGIASDGSGNLYVTDTEPNCLYTALRRVNLWSDSVHTLAVGGAWPSFTPVSAPFKCLDEVVFHEGKIYAVDRGVSEVVSEGFERHRIWQYDPSTAAVTGLWAEAPVSSELLAFCFDEGEYYDDAIWLWGSASEAHVQNQPIGAREGAPGGLLCEGTWFETDAGLDSWGSGHGAGSFYPTTAGAVVRIDRSSVGYSWEGGTVDDFAGTQAYNGPHTAGPEMRLESPSGVSSDASGNLVVFEEGNRFIRLSASGEVSALGCGPSAGGGRRNLSALSPAGDLYFLDGSALKKVDHATGECAVLQNIEVAGGPGAVRIDLVHDGVGKLYLSSFDPLKRQVIRIDAASGAYETLLDGRSGFLATDGQKQLFVAELADAGQKCSTVISRIGLTDLEPHAVPQSKFDWCATALAYDPVGVLYVAEASRNRVRALAVGTGEVVDLVGEQGHEAVWLGGLPASLNRPIDIALLPDGALAIADFDEHVVLLAR